MTYNLEATIKHRNKIKTMIVESMGGACQTCGYNKCLAALEIHHINPNEKDFSFNKVRANNTSWEKITKELRKCILLCSNCHREVHYNDLKIPENYSKFDERFAVFKKEEVEVYNDCPICKQLKKHSQKYCSKRCTLEGRKNTGKVNWETVNLLELKQKYKTNIKVAEILGVSDVYVSRRIKQLKITKL